MFNGGLAGGDSAYQASYQDYYWTMPDIPCTSTFRFIANNSGSPGDVVLVTDTGTASVTPAGGNAQWNTITLPGSTTKLTKLTVPQTNNSNWTDMIAVEVDGVVLIDPLVATPSNPPAFNTTEDADSATIGTQSALPITWPSNIKWNGGSAPTLYSEVGAINQISLLTRDTGVTWYGWEEMSERNKGDELWTWGFLAYGDSGINDRIQRSSPVQIPGTTWQKIYHTGVQYGIKNDGTLWAWGYNDLGACAQNNRTYYSSPVQIPGTTWKTIDGFANPQALAIKTDGSIWGWGNNQYGGLGQNNTTQYSSPVQMGSGRDWKLVKAGNATMGAIKTDGSLWTWGQNQRGEQGRNSADDHSSSPRQVGGDTTWANLEGQREAFLATKTDGTLWSWGYNSWGNGGHNNQTQYSSPMQVGTDTSWAAAQLTGRGTSSLAIKSDGTMWAWGGSNYGELGLNQSYSGSHIAYSSPVQVPGSWGYVYSTGEHTIASKPDGTLWAFGNNEHGNLAGNIGATPGARSSPTQIGTGTNWTVEGVMCVGKVGSALQT